VRRARGPAAASLVALVALAALAAAGCLPGSETTPFPLPTPSASPAPATASPSPAPTPIPPPSAPPTPGPSPSQLPTASPVPAGRATRVAVPALGIDLPVVTPAANSTWPLCDVAEYLEPPAFQNPGAGGVTYLYAHARAGMFLPILRASRIDGGRALVGQTVLVWTADDELFTYQVTRVRRHQTTLAWALELPPSSLVLQTSEDQYETGTKVMIQARLVGPPVAATRAEARPPAHPRVCGH
jgi:hypothetical protein